MFVTEKNFQTKLQINSYLKIVVLVTFSCLFIVNHLNNKKNFVQKSTQNLKGEILFLEILFEWENECSLWCNTIGVIGF